VFFAVFFVKSIVQTERGPVAWFPRWFSFTARCFAAEELLVGGLEVEFVAGCETDVAGGGEMDVAGGYMLEASAAKIGDRATSKSMKNPPCLIGVLEVTPGTWMLDRSCGTN